MFLPLEMTPSVLLRLSSLLALCASICQAQDQDITTKSVIASGKNGRPDIRCDSTYRGKECIMRVFLEKRASGDFVPYARSYQVGHARFVDSDEDRDGFFETLCLSEDANGGRVQVDVFRRERDGTIHPASAEERQKMQNMLESLSRFWKEALPSK
jgi:hypothetical protein